MKKQRDEEAADCGESANTFHRPSENVFFSFKAATAAEMLRKILEQASPDDIMGEYIWFLKNLPKLLNNALQCGARPHRGGEDRVGHCQHKIEW